MNFNCDKCGLCCRSLKKFGELYADLDDGSGVCKFFDKTSNLCTIYDMRPLKCRVEDVKLTFQRFLIRYTLILPTKCAKT